MSNENYTPPYPLGPLLSRAQPWDHAKYPLGEPYYITTEALLRARIRELEERLKNADIVANAVRIENGELRAEMQNLRLRNESLGVEQGTQIAAKDAQVASYHAGVRIKTLEAQQAMVEAVRKGKSDGLNGTETPVKARGSPSSATSKRVLRLRRENS